MSQTRATTDSGAIVFVEHGGPQKEFTLRAAVENGFRVVVVTTHPHAVIYKYTDPANVIIADTYDSEALIGSVQAFVAASKVQVAAVVTFKENSVVYAADLADALGHRGPGPEPARRSSQNKLKMRRAVQAAGGVPQPEYTVLNVNHPDGLAQLRAFPKPCVVKPLFGSSSHGVKKIENNDDILADIADAKMSMVPEDREIFKHFDGTMLVEAYVRGPVISIDGIVIDGRPEVVGATQFIMGDEPYFLQVGSFIPPRIAPSVVGHCEELTRRTIDILGFRTCGFHCEWRISDNGPVLLEIAARTVGGGILLGYEKATGVDVLRHLFLALAGRPMPFCATRAKAVLHKTVFPAVKSRAVLTRLAGIERIAAEPDVWHALQFARVGDTLEVLPKTPSQLYYYALLGNDVTTLQRRSVDIESLVLYSTAEAAEPHICI